MDKKAADNKVNKADKSDDINRKILDNAPMSIVTIDKDGLMTSANKYFQNFSRSKNFRHRSIFSSKFFIRENLREDYKRLLSDGTMISRENCYEKNNRGEDKYLKIIAVPLRDKAGNIEGALSMAVDNTEVVLYKNELEKLNRHLEAKVRERTVALEDANRELERLSTHDILTGLHNRNFLERRLQELRKRKSFQGTVMMIDINNLKKANDNLGHLAGDKLIQETANFLVSEFRDKDLISRFGGDEFCVILPDTEFDEAVAIADRLQAKIKKANSKNMEHMRLSISIGIACAASGQELDEAIKIADKKMYEDKLVKKKMA
jgi:diguanylate cyclase (GGDEF)-like protein/PAS domain S-box-containing protein